MEFRWLETFAVAAREGSMSSAAARLGYARSTVTGHVQGLERSLGAKLFDRSKPGHPLTMSGAALLKHAETVLEELSRARAAVAASEDGRVQSLRLGATESVCAYRLPVFLRMLNRLLPELKVEVEAAPVGALREQVAAGRHEVVLINGVREQGSPERRDETTQRRLWEEKVVLIGTPEAARRPRRVLLTAPGCAYREIVEREFLGRLPQAEVLQVGSVEGVKSSALSNLGIGLLPMVAAKPFLSGGQLVELPLRTSHTVVTDAIWNPEACPPAVVGHLQRLQSASGGEDR